MSQEITEERVRDALRGVRLSPHGKDVASAGIAQDVRVQGGRVTLTLELPSPAHPRAAALVRETEEALRGALGAAEARVKLAWRVKPADARVEPLPGVKNVIAVASGKGGVGKSTIATNLAVGLALAGARTGLLDLDIFGPSTPVAMGTIDPPEMTEEGPDDSRRSARRAVSLHGNAGTRGSPGGVARAHAAQGGDAARRRPMGRSRLSGARSSSRHRRRAAHGHAVHSRGRRGDRDHAASDCGAGCGEGTFDVRGRAHSDSGARREHGRLRVRGVRKAPRDLRRGRRAQARGRAPRSASRASAARSRDHARRRDRPARRARRSERRRGTLRRLAIDVAAAVGDLSLQRSPFKVLA